MRDGYIAASITKDYWLKAQGWIESVKKYAPTWELLLFAIDFQPPEGIHVSKSDVTTYKPGWCKNRRDYICLEGGEFLRFHEFEDDSFIMFMDVDMVMQRPMSGEELDFLFGKGQQEIGLSRDGNSKPEMYDPGYITTEALREAFPKSNDKPWTVYCCGLMAGYIQAWKRLLEIYEKTYPVARDLCPHHAIGQWIINHNLHATGNLVELPSVFHEGPWWHYNKTKKLTTKNKEGVWLKEGKPICFLHHKFNHRWGYERA